MKYIKINKDDNVAVALQDLAAGEVVEGVVLQESVPRGHKVLLKGLKAGDNVIKYGYPVGHVARDAASGTLIDHSCIKTNLEGLLEYKYEPLFCHSERSEESDCSEESSVDAIIAFPHNYGCSQLGTDHENTRTILADMVHHPNAGGVLVVSLGCENNQLDAFRELVGPVDESRVRMFATQKVGDEIEYGLQQLREIYATVSKDVRTEVPVSELRVGLKCGGSDGLSGITANPLLGVFSDWLVARGGTTVLTEVPEMFGAETILMNRCQDRATFDKTVNLINDFKEYFIAQGMPVYENPSPGNKAGGISTLEEKSLGCTQKCGKSIVRGVLKYGERLSVNGLNLLSAPGNDLVASTALGAAGCQIVLFTTGRGTPFGSFVPTMKISTNTPLFENKPGWIDFNAGVLAQDSPMEEVAPRFIDAVLAAASGEPVRAEASGYREIAIFKSGVTL